ILIEKYISWFDNYINSFVEKRPDLKENLLIKAEHSKKVRYEIIGIDNSLHLHKDELFLAEVIGLFHDIGRFEQYIKYETFSDSKSQNHADLGVEILKKENVLLDLCDVEREIVFRAIKNHSRATIRDNEPEEIEFFSQLIRDADKLDIWRLITEYYMVKEQNKNASLELDLPNSDEISEKVIQAILNREIVKKEEMNTLNDFKLLQIAWVFDLNFNYSKARLKEMKYLDKIFNTLPDNKSIENVKSIVREELEIEKSVNDKHI
nr:HD domain-containing protein [Bacteroidales bacterium]